MTDDLTPGEQAARAVVDFDQAVNDPARRYDAVGALFAGLAAATAQHAAEARAARTRWRNRPEAKARRSAAAKKAAATRAANKAAERAAELAEWERDARVSRPSTARTSTTSGTSWRPPASASPATAATTRTSTATPGRTSATEPVRTSVTAEPSPLPPWIVEEALNQAVNGNPIGGGLLLVPLIEESRAECFALCVMLATAALTGT
ncbi:hypothetical protein [Streptomyces mirabilis]|uniref:hypothetical protein n=1 Tax=Streptomyces mirabilis TaxID=68239 RepID=UPI0031BAE215